MNNKGDKWLKRFVQEQQKMNKWMQKMFLEHERWMRTHEVRLKLHWTEISRLKEK